MIQAQVGLMLKPELVLTSEITYSLSLCMGTALLNHWAVSGVEVCPRSSAVPSPALPFPPCGTEHLQSQIR